MPHLTLEQTRRLTTRTNSIVILGKLGSPYLHAPHTVLEISGVSLYGIITINLCLQYHIVTEVAKIPRAGHIQSQTPPIQNGAVVQTSGECHIYKWSMNNRFCRTISAEAIHYYRAPTTAFIITERPPQHEYTSVAALTNYILLDS